MPALPKRTMLPSVDQLHTSTRKVLNPVSSSSINLFWITEEQRTDQLIYYLIFHQKQCFQELTLQDLIFANRSDEFTP